MSDISILNILNGANASMEAGEALSAKGQANVEIEALDPELLAQLPSELKESLISKKDLPDFESMLMGEEVAPEPKALTGEKLQASMSTASPEVATLAAPKGEAKELAVESSKNSKNSKITEANPELLSALNKGKVEKAAVATQMSGTQEMGELTETTELPAKIVSQEELSAPQNPKLTKKANSNLKLISGEDFISTKNVSKIAPQGEVAPEAPVSEESVELIRNQAELMSGRARSAQANANPFMAQNAQLRGGLALNGAMFREALAVDSSEKEDALLKDEKKADVKITGVETKSLQSMDPALSLSARDRVSQSAAADKPVLNLSHIDARKTGDLISEISNYIDRSRLESKGEIDVWVHHKDLGTFQVQAGKSGVAGQNNVELKIETFSKEGQSFFNQNAPELVKHLQDAGVKVSDFQIKTTALNTIAQSSDSSNSGMGRDSNQQSQSQNQSQSGQFAGQNQRQGSESGGDRRRQMWQHYQETYRQRFAS